MSAPQRKSGRVADMKAASAAAKIAAKALRGTRAAQIAKPSRSAPVATKAVATAATEPRDGYKLSTELTKKTQSLIAKNEKEYSEYPINSEDWVVFFCDYFDFIQNNFDLCLSKIKGLSHLTIADLYKVDLSAGGFDSDFDNFEKVNYNIGLYETLFTQFKDGTNKINNCTRLNQLLSYVGAAVLRMAAHYNKTSANALIEFYRKIATILEIAVCPEVFLHFMTGDSTGQTHKVDLNYHGQAKKAFYTGIWVRKQEFLGVITSDGKNYWRKLDNGLRLFVRNYIRRLITYMRSYNATYPLGYELPYNYSADPTKIIRNPLPPKGVYQYSAPPENYYISRNDWNYIPDILLPDNCGFNSGVKDYIEPARWSHPPPPWWIERTVKFFGDTEWWRVKEDAIYAISAKLRGTVRHKKWMALNCILPQQYESYSELWDVEYEDERDDNEMYEGYDEAGHRGYGGGHEGLVGGHKGFAGGNACGLVGGYAGGISKMNTKGKARISVSSQKFKIIQDKDRKIHPDICDELKYKLREYFRLNVVIVKAKSAESHLVVKAKSAESHLRDDTYIDNLCNYSMLYNPRAHKMNKNKSGASAASSDKRPQRQRARTV
jgi:hypothetical protein